GLLSLLGILGFVWALSYLVKPNQKAGRAIHKDDSTDANKSEATVRPLVIPYVPPPDSKYHGPDRRKDNTPKWKKKTELGALVIALLLLLVNIFMGWGNWRAANAAKDAAKTAASTLTLSKRHIEDSDEAICEIRSELTEHGKDIEHVTILNT